MYIFIIKFNTDILYLFVHIHFRLKDKPYSKKKNISQQFITLTFAILFLKLFPLLNIHCNSSSITDKFSFYSFCTIDIRIFPIHLNLLFCVFSSLFLKIGNGINTVSFLFHDILHTIVF